jgi:two-component system KDP operon response regulator KdpE
VLKALRVGLTARGHEVVSAPPRDLGLPDLDGLAVCKQIRQMSDVPIVVLSATDTEERKVAALGGGADDYVTKQFGMAELEARIRTAIRHRGAEPDPSSAVLYDSSGTLIRTNSGIGYTLIAAPD